MFDEYRKKLEDIGANSDKVFKRVAKQGAIFFQKEAVRLTDQEQLVDTGTYRRNWTGEQAEIEGEQAIIGANSIEYASYLEEGYSIKRERFIPFDKLKGTPKSNNLINALKSKYPNAKGIKIKPRRFKGRFIGRRAMDETRYYVIKKLDDTFDRLFTKYQRGFTQSD